LKIENRSRLGLWYAGPDPAKEGAMNVEQVINMIMRMFLRKVVNKGMDVGIDRFAGKGKTGDEMSPDEQQMAKQGKQAVRRARQAARVARRVGKL
jgi:hypothetical protein